MIIDVFGAAPLLGRLRGVKARGELRQVIISSDRIYCDLTDPHFVFRGPPPSTLPGIVSNSERQLVLTRELAAQLPRGSVEVIPVQLRDGAGAVVSDDYVLAELKTIFRLEHEAAFSDDGYYYADIAGLRAPADLPALCRLQYTLLIAIGEPALASALSGHGVDVVPIGDYVESFWPAPPTSYALFRAGTEGASFEHEHEDEFEEGQSLAATWSATTTAKMKPPKSQKKLVDFMSGRGAPIISAKAKATLEAIGADGFELLPITALDHAGQPVKGEHWIMQVTTTADYVDIDESDIDVEYGVRWTAREIVVRDDRMTSTPAFFRVPGARYPWVFIRRDVRDALERAKLKGFRTTHPFQFAYPVDRDVDSVC